MKQQDIFFTKAKDGNFHRVTISEIGLVRFRHTGFVYPQLSISPSMKEDDWL